MRKPYDLIITQSLINDWLHTPCKLAFKERWIAKNIEWKTTEPMLWGNWFEYHAIGSTAHQDEIPELTPKMERSVTKIRAERQIEKWKDIKRILKIRDTEVQRYIQTTVEYVWKGAKIPIVIAGTEDINCTIKGKPMIIDIKTTGNVNNKFGDYSWDNPDTMDLRQAPHYTLLEYAKTGKKYGFMYIIFDFTPSLGVKLIECEITDTAMAYHQKLIFKVWNEIQYSLMNKEWETSTNYNICNNCPVKACKSRLKIPSIQKVIL